MSAADRRTPSAHPGAAFDDQGLRDESPSRVRPVVPPLSVPLLAVRAEGVRELSLDADSAYLLSLVDGLCTVEMILEICQPELSRKDAQDLLARMLWLGAIELRDR